MKFGYALQAQSSWKPEEPGADVVDGWAERPPLPVLVATPKKATELKVFNFAMQKRAPNLRKPSASPVPKQPPSSGQRCVQGVGHLRQARTDRNHAEYVLSAAQASGAPATVITQLEDEVEKRKTTYNDMYEEAVEREKNMTPEEKEARSKAIGMAVATAMMNVIAGASHAQGHNMSAQEMKNVADSAEAIAGGKQAQGMCVRGAAMDMGGGQVHGYVKTEKRIRRAGGGGCPHAHQREGKPSPFEVLGAKGDGKEVVRADVVQGQVVQGTPVQGQVVQGEAMNGDVPVVLSEVMKKQVFDEMQKGPPVVKGATRGMSAAQKLNVMAITDLIQSEVVPSAQKRSKSNSKKKGSDASGSGEFIPEVQGEAVPGSGSSDGSGEVEEEGWQKTVAESWAKVRALNEENSKKNKNGNQKQVAAKSLAKASEADKKAAGGGFMSKFRGNKTVQDDKGTALLEDGKEDEVQAQANIMSTHDVPQTFDDMIMFNAGIMGANLKFFELVLKIFDTLVVAVTSSDQIRMLKEVRLLAMRLYARKMEHISFKEFKAAMLASLRSLLPSDWDSEHELAWGQMWDTVSNELSRCADCPKRYSRGTSSFINGLSDKEKTDLSMNVFKRIFLLEPQTEFFFKQNNMRLIFIVKKVLDFTINIYESPDKIHDELAALGLKHIMWQIPPQFFQPFIDCVLAEIETRGADQLVMEGLTWALQTVAAIMVHTIEDGSNPLLRAVLRNNAKETKKELGKLARGDRMQAAVGGNLQFTNFQGQ